MVNFKLKVLFFFTVAILIISPGFVFAQRDLEVPLPGLGETKLPLLPNYVKYIFNFAIGLGGLIAFLVLIYGGVRYLTSAGNPAATGDAKDRISSAVLGIILLLGSWLILTTINPQLVIINPQLESPGITAGDLPGVYLCKDAASLTNGPDCQFLAKSSSELGALDNKVKNVKFINTADSQYGVVLHGEPSFIGNCAICTDGDCSSEISRVSGGVSSATIFVQAGPSFLPFPGYGVSLYKKNNYEVLMRSYEGYTWQHNLNQTGNSIKIGPEREWLAALFEGLDGTGRCEVFTRSDPALATNPIGICNGPNPWDISNYGCFTSVTVLPIEYPL